MRLTITVLFFLLNCSVVYGQGQDIKWYSETEHNGVIIQNSYNKGGSYNGPVKEYSNVSNLIYFTRIVNETNSSLELTVHFSADSFAIPNSPNMFVKLFLPSDTMTLDKRNLFNYGVADLETFDQPTKFQKKLSPYSDCIFNVVAIFYQTENGNSNQSRGGNRAEFFLKGQDLYFKMLPQIKSLNCGHITFND